MLVTTFWYNLVPMKRGSELPWYMARYYNNVKQDDTKLIIHIMPLQWPLDNEQEETDNSLIV